MMKDALSEEKIKSLDQVYKFGSIQNSEIHFKWIRIGIKARWHDIIQPAIKFVSDQGRMKFTRPVYKYVLHTYYLIELLFLMSQLFDFFNFFFFSFHLSKFLK